MNVGIGVAVSSFGSGDVCSGDWHAYPKIYAGSPESAAEYFSHCLCGKKHKVTTVVEVDKHTKVTDLPTNSIHLPVEVTPDANRITKKDSVPSNQIAEEGQKSTKSNPTIPQKELTEQIESLVKDLIPDNIRSVIDDEGKTHLENYAIAKREYFVGEFLDIVNQARVEGACEALEEMANMFEEVDKEVGEKQGFKYAKALRGYATQLELSQGA